MPEYYEQAENGVSACGLDNLEYSVTAYYEKRKQFPSVLLRLLRHLESLIPWSRVVESSCTSREASSMREIVTVALIGAGGLLVVALTALILDFRLFDSLGRQMALIESDLSNERLSRPESQGRKRNR